MIESDSFAAVNLMKNKFEICSHFAFITSPFLSAELCCLDSGGFRNLIY